MGIRDKEEMQDAEGSATVKPSSPRCVDSSSSSDFLNRNNIKQRLHKLHGDVPNQNLPEAKEKEDISEEAAESHESDTTLEKTSESDLITTAIIEVEKTGNKENDAKISLEDEEENKDVLGGLRTFLTFASRQRPRQPFMNQADRENQRLPPPPQYYSTQVTQEHHQPQLLRQSSNSRTIVTQPTSHQPEPVPVSTEPLPIREQPQRAVVQYDNLPQFQPGQYAFTPSPLLNIALWAPYPTQIPPNVPACLAHLVAADSLFITQQVDVLELFLGFEEPNTYLIQNSSGQCLYYAYESTDICGAVCCRSGRGFQLHIMDMYHNEIIYMNRPCGCSDYFCCYPVMEVYSPPLVPVGAIFQTFHPTHERFWIVDADEKKQFKIYGPCCLGTCGCCEADFTIHALDDAETEVGFIRREWGGLVRTYFTSSDFYGITFPRDLDVRIKAVFLGALFLIDYTFFES